MPSSWPASTTRAIGIMNMILGAVGCVLVVRGILIVLRSTSSEPFLTEVSFLRLGLNLVFLIVLILAGVFLVRFQRRGVLLTNIALGAEIAYLIFGSGLGLFLSLSQNQTFSLVGNALAATGGSGNIGLAPQLLLAYPLLALAALNIAFRKLKIINAMPNSASPHPNKRVR